MPIAALLSSSFHLALLLPKFGLHALPQPQPPSCQCCYCCCPSSPRHHAGSHSAIETQSAELRLLRSFCYERRVK
ncbi:hypothetical protein MA16_Dca003061 [Dendrobium catenatum]|uniref:Secreted protein n=1 Tax=Dendrobium catenatum TaxID=906689 RepID=A0A2I0XBN9_9ASPA|nr:hypothetical protein MA16_Dca003061 [Dendrobium catenatum]